MKLRLILGGAILLTLIICLIACPRYKPVKQEFNAELSKYKDSIYKAVIIPLKKDREALIEMNDNKAAALEELVKENDSLSNRTAQKVIVYREAKAAKDTGAMLSNCDSVVNEVGKLVASNVNLKREMDSLKTGFQTERALANKTISVQAEQNAGLQADNQVLKNDNSKLADSNKKKDGKIKRWSTAAFINGGFAVILGGILFLSN